MKKIESTIKAWEDGTLGTDENYVAISDSIDEIKLDECLGLKKISIRLDKGLIDDYKFLGEKIGLGYQTLMKQIMKRWADAELRKMAKDGQAKLQQQSSMAESDYVQQEKHCL